MATTDRDTTAAAAGRPTSTCSAAWPATARSRDAERRASPARRCGAAYPVRDGVLVVKDEPADDNKIARDFYNSPLWPKFRFWEWFFWVCNGGERRSRDVILRHLPEASRACGCSTSRSATASTRRWLPRRLVGRRHRRLDRRSSPPAGSGTPGRDLRLILGEAEALPFRDRQFDAVLSIGGFNHFNDPEAALREMARVAKPGATIVVSDELPDLTDRMLGHKLGLPGHRPLDRLAADEPRRRLHRPGRAAPPPRHRRDRPARARATAVTRSSGVAAAT